MPQRTSVRRVDSIPYQANQVVRRKLPVSGIVRHLWLELRGVCTVTDVTGATALARNPGTLVPSITVYLNGEVVVKQGRWNDWRDRNGVFHRNPTAVPVVAANAAYSIFDAILIPFQTPWSARPVDTGLNMNPGGWQQLEIEVQWGDASSLLASGTKSFTTDPTIDVIAEMSAFDPPPSGLYKELAFDSPALGAVANTDLQLPLVVGPGRNYHHLILAAEDNPGAAGRGLVATVLNKIRLQQQGAGDISSPIGEMTGLELQNEFQMRMRELNVPVTGIYPIVFQPRFEGLSTYNLMTWDPNGNWRLDDLRFLIDHAAFATAGTIRVMQGIVEPLI